MENDMKIKLTDLIIEGKFTKKRLLQLIDKYKEITIFANNRHYNVSTAEKDAMSNEYVWGTDKSGKNYQIPMHTIEFIETPKGRVSEKKDDYETTQMNDELLTSINENLMIWEYNFDDWHKGIVADIKNHGDASKPFKQKVLKVVEEFKKKIKKTVIDMDKEMTMLELEK